MEKILSSEKQTEEFAKSLIEEIKESASKENASVIALEGDLGTGKTKFTQFLAKNLGIKQNITSPSFLIMKKYPLAGKEFEQFIHIDAYRITEKELKDLDFDKIIDNPKNIVIIEWADRVKGLIPENARRVKFSHGKIPEERLIEIKND